MPVLFRGLAYDALAGARRLGAARPPAVISLPLAEDLLALADEPVAAALAGAAADIAAAVADGAAMTVEQLSGARAVGAEGRTALAARLPAGTAVLRPQPA